MRTVAVAAAAIVAEIALSTAAVPVSLRVGTSFLSIAAAASCFAAVFSSLGGSSRYFFVNCFVDCCSVDLAFRRYRFADFGDGG